VGKFRYRFTNCQEIGLGSIALCNVLEIWDVERNLVYSFRCFEQLDFMCVKNAIKIIKCHRSGVGVRRVHATELVEVRRAG
jgi:hypothetical protein